MTAQSRKVAPKIHMAVDTLGHLLALHMISANEQDRAEIGKLCKAVQKETGKSVELAFVESVALRGWRDVAASRRIMSD